MLLVAVVSGAGQVEFGIVVGVGPEFSSLQNLLVEGTPEAETTSDTGGGSLSVGIFAGSRPYEGLGWRGAVEVSSREITTGYSVPAAQNGRDVFVVSDSGAFVDGHAQLTYQWANWWGVGLGGGVSSHFYSNARRPIVGVMAISGVTWSGRLLTLELRAMALMAPVDQEHFRVASAPERQISARLAQIAPSFNAYLAIGRSTWLRGEQKRVPIYNPRGLRRLHLE